MFIDQEQLLNVLRKSLTHHDNITQQFQTEISDVHISDIGNRVTLKLSNDQSDITSKLLVVSEGNLSQIADSLRVNKNGWSHNQKAIVANIYR